MSKASESIFDGLDNIIPMADVSHIQRHWYSGDKERTKHNYRGLIVVTKHTTWDKETDNFANNIYISAGKEAESFLECWCHYRYEIEREKLGAQVKKEHADYNKAIKVPVIIRQLADWERKNGTLCALLPMEYNEIIQIVISASRIQ